MRTVGSAVVALLFAGSADGQSGATRVTNYHFMISIPDTGTEIRVRAYVDLGARVVRSSGDTLRLHFNGMTVDSVSSPLGHLPFRTDTTGLIVPLPENLLTFSTGDVAGLANVTVDYHGTPKDGLIIGTNTRGARVVFGDNWPERARNWLPVVDRPGAKATVSFSVDAPVALLVVAPGRSADRRPTDGARIRWWWQERHPIPVYTMVIGVGKFTVSKHRPVINGRDTIPIEIWTYPEDSAYADSVPFRRATEIVEVMQRLIGPFPYEKLAHVQSSTRFGGMENSSAIFYAEKPYVERRMGEGVVRHETAHQWFGDAVTPRDWPHLWLSEGFATYFDGVIGAALDGDSVLVNAMRSNAETYFKSDVTDRPIVDSANAAEPMKLLNANSYPKGAWVLHMLRGLIGDEPFFSGLRTYYRTYRDSTATSEDFQHVMERASGKDLSWFFHQWLYQPGYPQLGVTWQHDAGAGRMLLGITQRQKPGWGLFRLPVLTLEFRDANGRTLRRDIAVTGAETSAHFDLPFAPSEVRVDPDGRLLLRVTAISRR